MLKENLTCFCYKSALLTAIVDELKSIIRDKDMEIELLNTKLNAREVRVTVLKLNV